MHPVRSVIAETASSSPAAHRATTTPREDFGTALAALARLYSTAERRGDLAGAERYAAAVDLLLVACPSSRDAEAGGCLPVERSVPLWPSKERTLVGLGILP